MRHHQYKEDFKFVKIIDFNKYTDKNMLRFV